MKTLAALGALALVVGLTLPVAAQSPGATEAVQAQMGPGGGGPGGPGMGGPGMQRGKAPGGWQRHARHGHMRRGGRSVVFMALRHQKELGLSPQQVSALQQLGTDAARAGIQRQANAKLARLDLMTMLRTSPVDMAKVEAKVRDIERLRADGMIARIRTNEAAKAQLSADQQEKLKSLRAAGWQRRGGGEGGGDAEPSALEERS